MLTRLKKYIAENNMIQPGDRVLLAVSGGIDSMVMAHLFRQLDTETAIAHCNFSLRGAESDKDEQLVREYASENNIPFFTVKFNTKEFASEHGLSIQMAARDLRYNWFEEISNKHNYNKVAVAHNLNDNIETVLINMTRGTGLTGLTGIRPVSNKIIRPLLFATRHDITDYCNEHSITFREDQSNSDTKYTRNKIRHLVIPVLKEINPSIENTLNEMAERFTGINDIVADYISLIRREISANKGDTIIFDSGRMEAHLRNRALVFELFRPYGINNLQIDDLIQVIEGKTGGHIVTQSHRIIKNREEIIISAETIPADAPVIINSIEELKKVSFFESVRYIDIDTSIVISTEKSEAYLDADKITFPVTIRKWRSGDHFFPFGMKQKKKLSDYFIDRKYSMLDKENILILESAGEIVWIIGERIDDRYRITPSTKTACVLAVRSKK